MDHISQWSATSLVFSLKRANYVWYVSLRDCSGSSVAAAQQPHLPIFPFVSSLSQFERDSDYNVVHVYPVFEVIPERPFYKWVRFRATGTANDLPTLSQSRDFLLDLPPLSNCVNNHSLRQ